MLNVKNVLSLGMLVNHVNVCSSNESKAEFRCLSFKIYSFDDKKYVLSCFLHLSLYYLMGWNIRY